VMYMMEPGEATATVPPLTPGVTATLLAAALGTLFLGTFPSVILNFAASSSVLVK